MSKISYYNNYNNDKFEASDKTSEYPHADGMQDRFKFQGGVIKSQTSLDKNNTQLFVDGVTQNFGDDLITIDTKPKPTRLVPLRSSPLSYNTGEPYDTTLERSSKLNATVFNNGIVKPSSTTTIQFEFPPGCKCEAQAAQRAGFAMEQEEMDKIKRKRIYYRAYMERRVELGLGDVADPISAKILNSFKKKNLNSKTIKLDTAKLEKLSHHSQFQVYEDVLNNCKEYHGNNIKKGRSRCKKAVIDSPHRLETLKKVIAVAEAYSKQLEDNLPNPLIDGVLDEALTPELEVSLAVIAYMLKRKRMNS